MSLAKFWGEEDLKTSVETDPAYRECTSCGEFLHYSEYTLAGRGWRAPDDSKRQSQCRNCKRINQVLVNGLRIFVNGIFTSIGSKSHPNHSLWLKIKQQVQKENPIQAYRVHGWHGLTHDLTKEAYIRTYNKLGIEIPDLEKVLHKKHGRGSSNEDKCLDYLNVPKNEGITRQVRIGSYYVDGLVDKDVYEFFGDYYHGNPKIYSSKERIKGSTVGEKWEKDKNRAEIIKSKGYNFKVIWESDWSDFQQGRSNKLKIIEW